MEKEEKNIVEPVVNTVDNNEPIVEPTQDENPEENVTVDDNTEPETTEVIPGDDTLTGDPVVDAPVEDPTLATTDEVIPAVPGETTITEPEVVDPIVDIDNPPVDTVIGEDPAALAPAEPVDAPVENPVASDIIGPGPEAVCTSGDSNCDGACGIEPCEETPCDAAPAITIGQYFGTLQESVTIVWRYHLKTRKYSVHIALNEFYEKALDIIDDIIEQYQGICGVVEEPFVNCVIGEGKTEGEYITELKAFVENNRCVASCGHSEIDSTIDEFLGLIDSTNYKLVNLTENAVKSFEEFVYEDYKVDESCCHKGPEEDEYGLEEPDNAEEE